MITDDQVRVALSAQDRKVNELEKYPICENYSRLEIDAEGMRAALTAFLSSVGGEPAAYVVPSARACHDGSYEDGPDSICLEADADDYVKRVGAPLYTAEALAARVAGGGEVVAKFLPAGTEFLGDGLGGKTLANCFEVSHQGKSYYFELCNRKTHPATARAGADLEQFRKAVDCMRFAAQGLRGIAKAAMDQEADRLTKLIDQQGDSRG